MLARAKRRADEAKVRFWPGNNIGYFGPYEGLLRASYPQGHMGSCGAGRATLGIEANGDIKGCPSLPTSDYVGGNVRDASLKDIWERSAPLRFTRDRTTADLWGCCADCYYASTASAAAPGRRTSSSAGRGTTRSATTAPSSCCGRAGASASCAPRARAGCPSTTGASRSSRSRGRPASSNERAPWPRAAKVG